MGHDGGGVVIVSASCSKDPSSIPADHWTFLVLVREDENRRMAIFKKL